MADAATFGPYFSEPVPIKGNAVNNVFAPGCALYLYKPDLAEKLFTLLQQDFPGL